MRLFVPDACTPQSLFQLTAQHQVATPPDWKAGEDVIIVPAVSDEDAKKRFPGFVAKKPYLRVTPQPKAPAST